MSIEARAERITVVPQSQQEATVLADLIPTQTGQDNWCETITAPQLPPEGSLARYALDNGISPKSVAAKDGWDRHAIGLVKINYSK